MHHNSKTRFSKRNSEFNVNNYDNNFCFLNQVKLNKGVFSKLYRKNFFFSNKETHKFKGVIEYYIKS